ncbi:MAG TPA: DUF72 domain-containing protein [Pelomicrobium sp.]|nr:DUF72 domain-containing protein [Pelomicrobium sp.]
MAGTLRVGTSGYQYADWRSRFYPDDLPKKRWFAYYADHFDTVEINNTFYNLPEAGTFDDWREEAPRGFRYALKYSRYGSHMKRLKDPDQHVDTFVERAERLKSALGPVLVQLPPNFKADPGHLDEFLAAAPRRLRWVVEFRDPSWLDDAVYKVLENRGAALCIHDMLDDHPRRVTAKLVYLRFHGKNYGGSYSPQRLTAEAKRVRGWLGDGLDVWAYFNNDKGGHAVHNAQELRRYATD